MFEEARKYWNESKEKWDRRWHFWYRVERQAAKFGWFKLVQTAADYREACSRECVTCEMQLYFLEH